MAEEVERLNLPVELELLTKDTKAPSRCTPLQPRIWRISGRSEASWFYPSQIFWEVWCFSPALVTSSGGWPTAGVGPISPFSALSSPLLWQARLWSLTLSKKRSYLEVAPVVRIYDTMIMIYTYIYIHMIMIYTTPTHNLLKYCKQLSTKKSSNVSYQAVSWTS